MEFSATDRALSEAEKGIKDIGRGVVLGSVNLEDTFEQNPEGCREATCERPGASSCKLRQQQSPPVCLVEEQQGGRVARGAGANRRGEMCTENP